MRKLTSQKATYRVQFRRRREGLTNYRYRERLLRSGLPRAVVRRTLRNMIVQFVQFEPTGDRVLATATAHELKKLGWEGAPDNTSAAYLTGYLAAHRAKAGRVSEAVLDIGLQAPVKGGRVFSALKGIVDAGVKVPHSPEILPKPERIHGKDKAAFDSFRQKLEGHGYAPKGEHAAAHKKAKGGS